MSTELPIGRKESDRLELKGRDSLEQPDSIAREVVGLLNSDGGEVWVGVREDRGVAVEVEGLRDPERERDCLRDRVVDLIEPQPAGDEVRIEIVGEAAKALRIIAKPNPGRRPYALRRGGRLEFPLRFMDRLRPMTRTELENAFAAARTRSKAAEAPSLTHAEQPLLAAQREILAADAPIFWLGTEPAGETRRLDLERLLESRILEDPPLSNNRWGGINFHLTLRAALFDEERAGPRVEHHQGRTWLRVGGKSPFELSISETGGLRSKVLLSEFLSPPEPDRSPFPELRDAQILNPKALLEYPASLFRLLRALGEHGLLETRIGKISAAVALSNVEGWYIRPGPDHPAWDYPYGLRPPPPGLQRRPQPFTDGDSFVGPVLRFAEHDVLETPDACAFRLMTQIFDAFGWLEGEIPYFDRAKGKLDFLS